MFNNDDTPGWLERKLADHGDEHILRALLVVLLLSTAGVLALDMREIVASTSDVFQPGTTRLEPMPMREPKPDDHLRPYLPKARPVAPDGGSVRLPGYARPPKDGALGKPMVFRRGKNGRVSAVGVITSGTAGRFERFLTTQGGEVKQLVLHSSGGSVRDAIAMARLIRKKGITTHVPRHGYCASSCPLVFSGGARRTAGKPAWIGVHQVFSPPSEVGTLQEGMAGAQEISALCQRLFVDMGIELEAWIHAMATPKHKLYVFTRAELKRYRLIGNASTQRARKSRPRSSLRR